MTSIVLPACRSAASRARHFTRHVLSGLDVPSVVIDDAELMVSELVTNAVLHARSSSIVDIERVDDHVRVSVRDDSPALPRLREAGADATTGRGLLVVDRMARHWGVDRPERDGKIVWFELDALEARPVEGPH